MGSKVYNSEALLAGLRAATGSTEADECEMCNIQHRVVCHHLTVEQYASLKTTKRTLDTERHVLRVFECGHVYRGLRRAWRNIGGPKVKTEGFCSECWRWIASDRRRVRLDHAGKVRSTSKEPMSRSRVDTTRYKRLRGKFKVWRLRGPMVGRRQV
ncbi:hypothetical protein GGS24DRAFT_166829 [Hypoxylon argillaceum]|nr:hypothetical protein GGS24DRAFT_166829 [Hypoxylon argillaceum]